MQKGTKDIKDITKSECQTWAQIPEVNPMTGRNIKIDGPTYNKIEKACSSTFGIRINNAKKEAKKAPVVKSPIIDSQKNPDSKGEHEICKGPIRACTGYTFLKSNFFSPRRVSVCYQSYAQDVWQAMQANYSYLSICESPLAFNPNTLRQSLDSSRNYLKRSGQGADHIRIGNIIMATLSVKYGEVIVPGRWWINFLNGRTVSDKHRIHGINQRLFSDHKEPAIDTMEQVIAYVKDSDLPILVMPLSVMIYSAHAVGVIFYKIKATSKAKGIYTYKDRSNTLLALHAVVIDPHMKPEGNKYDMIAIKALTLYSKKLGFNVETGVFVNNGMQRYTHYQGANFENKSSIDLGGYCQTWVPFIFEIIANRTLQLESSNTERAQVASFLDPPAYISNNYPKAWRKMIVDYLFTRLTEAYALACHLGNEQLEKVLYDLFISKNMQSIDNDVILSSIADQVGHTDEFYQRIMDDFMHPF